MTPTITIQTAHYTPPVEAKEDRPAVDGYWTATICVDATDGTRVSPIHAALPEDATEEDLLKIAKAQWESVPGVKEMTIPAKHKRAKLKKG